MEQPLKSKILLVLDLDETLVHSVSKKDAYELTTKPDFSIMNGDFVVFKRPGLEEFLTKISKIYDLAIWSSATDDYLAAMLPEITPLGVEYEFIWGRNRCTDRYDIEYQHNYHEKHLNKIKSHPLSQILIVDDSPEKARANYGNWIPIKAFTTDKNDNSLLKLYQYLMSLTNINDVRKIDKRSWSIRS